MYDQNALVVAPGVYHVERVRAAVIQAGHPRKYPRRFARRHCIVLENSEGKFLVVSGSALLHAFGKMGVGEVVERRPLRMRERCQSCKEYGTWRGGRDWIGGPIKSACARICAAAEIRGRTSIWDEE